MRDASASKIAGALLALLGSVATAQEVLLAPTAAEVPSAPLAEAAMRGDRAAVLELLAAGADANGADRDGTPTLHWLVRVGDRATAERLVAAGADVDAPN